jgi:hypothetical protein
MIMGQGLGYGHDQVLFLFSQASVPTFIPISVLSGGYWRLARGATRLGSEADHSLQSRVFYNNAWICTCRPALCFFLLGA